MKALVWIGSLLVFAVVQNALKSCGIILGAAPTASLFLACTSFARRVSRKMGR